MRLRCPDGVRVGWGIFLIFGLSPTGPAIAASPNITTGISVSESYNDNVNLAPSGSKQADWVTTISPSVNVATDGPRVKFGLLYNPQELVYMGPGATQRLQQNLTSTGTAVLYPDVLFLEENASIDQQIVSNQGPIASTTQTTNNNVQTVEAYTLSPVVRHHFASYADSETRFTYGDVSTGGSMVAPLQTNTFLQRLTSGDYFGRFGWTLTGNDTRDKSGTVSGNPLNGTNFKDEYGQADLRYAIYQGLSALGSVGYEKIYDPTLNPEPKGVYWNGGFKYQPSPITSLSFTYGRRYGQTDYEFDALTDIGPQTHVTASYSTSINTTQSLISSQLGQLGFGNNGQPINTVTGLPFNANGVPLTGVPGSPFGITNQAFILKTFQATVLTTQGRNTFMAVASYSTEQFDQPPSREKVWTGGLNWSRQLWPNLTSNFGATYERTVFDTLSQNSNLYSLNANLVYTISPTAAATFTVLRSSSRQSSPTGKIDNDVVTVSLSKTF